MFTSGGSFMRPRQVLWNYPGSMTKNRIVDYPGEDPARHGQRGRALRNASGARGEQLIDGAQVHTDIASLERYLHQLPTGSEPQGSHVDLLGRVLRGDPHAFSCRVAQFIAF